MSALDDLIETHHTEVRLKRTANWHMHEQALEKVAAFLRCPVQMVQDALYQVSVERVQSPVVILDTLYDTLMVLDLFQHHEEEEAP